jgi:hypothetical protein
MIKMIIEAMELTQYFSTVKELLIILFFISTYTIALIKSICIKRQSIAHSSHLLNANAAAMTGAVVRARRTLAGAACEPVKALASP